METQNIINILMMLIVGTLAGTLASRIIKGSDSGLVINALLGIAGAIVGGFIFNLLKLTPGQGITNVLSKNFGVSLPVNFVGMIVSATVGAIVILILARFLRRNISKK